MAFVDTLIAISLAVLTVGALAGVSMALYCSGRHLLAGKPKEPIEVEQAGEPA